MTASAIVAPDALAACDYSDIDILTLECIGHKVNERLGPMSEVYRLSAAAQEQRINRSKRPCKAIVVYVVFPPDGRPEPSLPMCNQCFNEYFESHEIEAEMVMRLSDDESDFVTGDKRARMAQRRRRQRLARESAANSAANSAPLCQVPRTKTGAGTNTRR